MKSITVKQFLEEVYLPSKFLRQNTVASYRYATRGIESLLISDLNAERITDCARSLLANNNSPHTVRARVGVLCVLWRCAIDRGFNKTPFRRPALPRAPQIIIHATAPEAIGKLIDACSKLPGNIKALKIPKRIYWPAFVAATYETALRTSDLLQLRYNAQGVWHLTQIKTTRPVTVGVSAETLEMIRRLSACSPNLFDLGWSREWYCRGLLRISRRAGLGDITPQQIRQSAASEIERIRPGAAWLALGHGSPATCQRWYIDSDHAYRDLPRPSYRP